MGAILRDGFETGDATSSGWSCTPRDFDVSTISGGPGILPRKDFNGNGGSYLAYSSDNTDITAQKLLKREAREFFFRFAYAISDSFVTFPRVSFTDSSNRHITLILEGGSNWRFKAPNNTDRGVESGIFSTGLEWWVIEGHAYIDNSSGFFRGYANYNYSDELWSHTGDTQEGGVNFVDRMDILVEQNNKAAYDDFAVNDITMSYSGGSGTLPSVGDSILGQTSSATAIITAILPGSDATSGTLQLREVQDGSATDWSGFIADDPFGTEIIDDSLSSNLWSANITGLDKNSGFPEDGYIIGLLPNGDVAGKIQLNNTTGPSNFQDIDNVPPDDADYVSTTTDGNRDVYELTNIPFSLADLNEITAVEINTRWQKTDLTLNNGRVIMEHSGTEYETEQKSLPGTGFDGDVELYDTIPDGTDFNGTNINSLRVGIKFET